MGMLNQVDTTSAEASADPNVPGAPASVQGGVNEARAAADATSGAGAGDESASPEEQQSYEQAMSALQQVVYENDTTADAIAEMVQESNKIDSTVQAVLVTLSELDKKLDMDEGIIAQIAMELTDMVMDVATEGKGIQYTEQEAQAVWGSVWEGVMEMYGVDEEEYTSFTEGMSDDDIAGQEQTYKGFLGE